MSDFTTLIVHPDQSVSFKVPGHDPMTPETWHSIIHDLDQLFTCDPERQVVTLTHQDTPLSAVFAETLPLLDGQLSRQAFYQLPLVWHQHTPSSNYPLQRIQSNAQYRHHPLRPPMPQGYVYKRYDNEAAAEVSFRTINLEQDLARFTRWMNDPRVAEFWEQAWSEEALAAFLNERLADPHILPLIGEFNGQPFGYVEAYWVAEDRLSPYFDVQDFDRGIHLLVGESAFRGPTYFNAWIRAISHYLFIDDIRTQRIVLEPRADNQRLFNRIIPMGYRKQFEFNFPHKRSALLMLNRESFFTERWS
ncbi:GNAT family N-acetyltransferase [Vibrio zhugei]|uniref:GNAT family N-acetyltransferase n=1 Tax=Vibrio zhugei TaxID=2479546 RepID=A0ABV7C7U4_9VIBR|nr:GNAT family N-acetyltransferase [Vibrio zhugei]